MIVILTVILVVICVMYVCIFLYPLDPCIPYRRTNACQRLRTISSPLQRVSLQLAEL